MKKDTSICLIFWKFMNLQAYHFNAQKLFQIFFYHKIHVITYHRDITGALWYVPHAGKASNITITWILWSISKKETSYCFFSASHAHSCIYWWTQMCSEFLLTWPCYVTFLWDVWKKQKQKYLFASDRSLTTDHRLRK